MLYILFVLFFANKCWSSRLSDETRLNDINNSVQSFEIPNAREVKKNMKPAEKKSSGEDDEGNFTVSWDDFTASLRDETLFQLEIVKQNIKISYRLSNNDIQDIENSFSFSANEYLQLIKHNMKKIIDDEKYNTSLDFMIDFVELSNFVLEKTLETTLANVGGKLLLPTKWYKQSMKQKILRQQTKIATNHVECSMCWNLAVCKDRVFYTQYLTEWIRQFLGFSPEYLKNLFAVIPNILSKHMHTIKSTIKFMKTVKYIVNNDDIVQRDTLDYLDEVITAQKNVQNLVPVSLKKGAFLLKELFQLIDAHYDINEENEDQLENISKLVMEWQKRGDESIKLALENILTNLQINMKIWPLDIQNKIGLVWTQIISL